jgi:hypothetical protein
MKILLLLTFFNQVNIESITTVPTLFDDKTSCTQFAQDYINSLPSSLNAPVISCIEIKKTPKAISKHPYAQK